MTTISVTPTTKKSLDEYKEYIQKNGKTNNLLTLNYNYIIHNLVENALYDINTKKVKENQK